MATVATKPAVQAERYQVGEWVFDTTLGQLEQGDAARPLEPRQAQVLLTLCQAAGEVLSVDALLQACWPGESLGDNPVHKSLAGLRRALGDHAAEPRYIETLRKRGYRLIAPVKVLQHAQSLVCTWPGGSPFRGLQAFDERHAAVFCGRTAATRSLWRVVQGQLHQGSALGLLLGPSGCGKTSLVRAGLIPHWLAQGEAAHHPLAAHATLDLGDVLAPTEPVGPQPPLGQGSAWPAVLQALNLALAASVLDWEVGGQPCLPHTDAHSLAQQLNHNPAQVGRALAARLHAAGQSEAGPEAWDTQADGAHAAPAVLLLFVDRLEALFGLTAEDPELASSWLSGLQQLSEHAPVFVLAACRNDFYPQLAAQPWLLQARAQGAHMDLSPPGTADIVQMVRLPAQAAGLSFERDSLTQQGLDDVLVDAASRSPDALPLLQYALQQLYVQRDAQGCMHFAAYQALGGEQGGLEGLIAAQAEWCLQSLSPSQQAGLPHVLSLLVTVGEEEAAPVASHRARWADLQGTPERELVQALVDARLLVSDGSPQGPAGSGPGFRLAHEALLRRWPRVTDWIAQHRQDLHTRARLRQQVQRWAAAQRASEFLLPRGRQLRAALGLQAGGGWALSDDEQAYIEASRRRARGAARRRQATLLALALLVVLSAVLAWRAIQSERAARDKRATSEQLLSFMLGEMSDQLRPEGRLALLEGVGQKALQLLGDEPESPTRGPEERLQRAKALILLGDVYHAKKQQQPANQAYSAALRLVRPLASSGAPIRPEQYSAWVEAEFGLGLLAREAGELDAAQAHYQAQRAACLQWRQAWPNDVQAQQGLGVAESNLGVLALRRLRLPEAQQQFDRANAIAAALLEQQPEALSHLQALLQGHVWQMEVALMAGNPDRALQAGAQALALSARWQALAPDDQRLPDTLAAVYDWQAEALHASGQLAKARATQQQVLALRSRLAGHDPANLNWQLQKFRAQLNLWQLETPSRLAQAELAQAASQLQAWRGQLPPAQWRSAAAKLAVLQARALLADGRHAQALSTLQQAPARPDSGVLNLRGSELQDRAELDTLLLQGLQPLAAVSEGRAAPPQPWRLACEQARAFWLPLQATPLHGRFPQLQAQLGACTATP